MNTAEVPKKQVAGLLVTALLIAKLAVLFVLAWNRRFVMDEFEQLGWAKYLGHGFFDTIWPAKAVGFQLFILPAHLIGWDAASILHIGRMQTALLACATLAIVYATARALGESRLGAALILLILLSFSNFMERIFETRAEPLAVFFGAAALLVALRAGARNWGIVAAGVLSGLAFLSTQKALYLDVALGLALAGDAVLQRRFRQGFARGALLVLGWLLPVALYCVVFGGSDPLAVARNLVFGPVGVASSATAAEYGGLRHFVIQTVVRNAVLYGFCFAGIALALLRFRNLGERARIALVFSIVITLLVFAHNQPWPYVFVMALPFLALWAVRPIDAIACNPLLLGGSLAVLAIAIAGSFARNIGYLQIDNHRQLALVSRVERLMGPEDVYFDGVGMLPNRPEPSTLWLDRHTVLETLRQRDASEAHRIFANAPPKLIIWTYRTDAVAPVVAPLIRESYVHVAPNIWLAGARLRRGEATMFKVPIAGRYSLYDASGRPAEATVNVNGSAVPLPLHLPNGPITMALTSGPAEALLLPVGTYAGQLNRGADDKSLFDGVYD